MRVTRARFTHQNPAHTLAPATSPPQDCIRWVSSIFLANTESGINRGTVDASTLLECYRTMTRIRLFEEEVLNLASEGLIPGFIHPCTGHEAIATGVLQARDPQEWVVTYYRGHGHALACGCDPVSVLREIATLRNGLCQGKGGSMHLADRSARLLGATSIVASQLPIAAGAAMAELRNGSGRASLAFCGDGAFGAGLAYETLTIARKLMLPLLVVCEDNSWQDHTPSSEVRAASPAQLCTGLGVPYEEVDGNDVESVTIAATEMFESCRSAQGPHVLVANTYLRDFHAQSGPNRPKDYRPADEVAYWRTRDPLARAAARLVNLGIDPGPTQAEVADEITEIVSLALADQPARLADAAAHITAAAWPEPAR
ncbi:thiamine pyrophosphate-dependent dehydrogenase E1 component subunit alpha [Amycolatopsis sp. NPDC054798]